MSKFVLVNGKGKKCYVNTSHIVRIEEIDAPTNYRCKLYLSDGLELEIEETVDSFVGRCND